MRSDLVQPFVFAVALVATSNLPAAGPDTLYIPESIPYEDEGLVDPDALKCTELGAQFSESLEEAARDHDFNIMRTNDELEGTASFLDVRITGAVSGRDIFLGHAKFASASASLVIDGAEAGRTEVKRTSGGGFGSGFKSSCRVLARTVNALGRDIADWLSDNHSSTVATGMPVTPTAVAISDETSDTDRKVDADVRSDNSVDLYNELLKLDDLRQKGILTEEEFAVQKARLLGNSQ